VKRNRICSKRGNGYQRAAKNVAFKVNARIRKLNQKKKPDEKNGKRKETRNYNNHVEKKTEKDRVSIFRVE